MSRLKSDSVPEVQTQSPEDDGLFDGGNAGDAYYKKTFEERPRAEREQAAKGLREAEDGASDKNEKDEKTTHAGSISNQRSLESKPESEENSFVNHVTGRHGREKKKQGFLKKKGPLVAIFMMLMGIGGASYMGQSAMPISLISQLQGNFDSIGVSTNMRTKSLFRIQLQGGRTKTCVKSGIFSGPRFSVSARQKTKLSNYGITFDTDADGSTVMRFHQNDGTDLIVHASEFEAEYNGNKAFRDAYYSGSRTWRASVADWFDSMSMKFFNWIGVKRTNFSGFRKTNNSDTDDANFRTKVTEVADDDSFSGSSRSARYDDDGNGGGVKSTDEDTLNVRRSDVPTDSNGDYDPSRLRGSQLESEVTEYANKKGNPSGQVAGTAAAIANGFCTVMNTIGAISMIVVAYQTTQIINTASTIFEGIQRGQISSSSSSPINEIANSLTKATTTTYAIGDGSEKVTRTRSAMEADAVSSMYGNKATNIDDPSVSSFNITSIVRSIGPIMKFGVDSFQACTYAKIAANMVGVFSDIICLISWGIGCLVDSVMNISFTQVATIAISLAIPYIIPAVAKVLTRKIATEVMGEDLGNAIVSGANMYMGQNHQFSGGSLADKDSFLQYISVRDQVIAEQARIERETRSPFDITSQYTFLGSLFNKSIPLLTKMSSLTSGINGFTTVLGSSIRSLLPAASAVTAAYTAESAAEQTKLNCPYLESIGAVGDSFCNPYFITDTRTLNADPADIVNKVQSLGGFENNEPEDVPTIKKNSDLAKYIVYCGQRQSQFGMPDQNISSDVQALSTGSNLGDTLIGLIPIVGDIVDVVDNSLIIANYGYVTGSACVTNNKRSSTATFADWNDNQYYQRFIEDQRLAESMGLVDKSAVTAFLDDYYEEHPLDNSYEGILARRSGLTKENVIIALNNMERLMFLEDYNPTDMYPVLAEKQDDKIYFEELQAEILPSIMVSIQQKFTLGRRQEIALSL